MKKILSTTAIAGSLCLLGTSAFAQTKAFEGGHVAIFGSFAGAEVSGRGTSTPATGSSAQTGSGSVGKVTPLGGLDLGYSFAAGKDFVIGVGVSYIPLKAEIGEGNVDSSNKISGELKNHYTLYLQPTFIINKDAAAYIKAGYNHADLSVTNATGVSGDVKGWLAGLGLKVMLTPNSFMAVEASYSDYDSIAGTRTTTSGGTSTSTRVSGDPKVAQGSVVLGFKF